MEALCIEPMSKNKELKVFTSKLWPKAWVFGEFDHSGVKFPRMYI